MKIRHKRILLATGIALLLLTSASASYLALNATRSGGINESRAEDHEPADNTAANRADDLSTTGQQALNQGDTGKAVEHLSEAVELYKSAGEIQRAEETADVLSVAQREGEAPDHTEAADPEEKTIIINP